MSVPHPIPWIFLLLIVALGQWVVILLPLTRRLERLYPTVWNQLGRPIVPPPWRKMTIREEWRQDIAHYRLMLLVGLPDRQTTLLIWCARLGWGLMAVLVVLSFAAGPISYQLAN
jgi:hypothetical protein